MFRRNKKDDSQSLPGLGESNGANGDDMDGEGTDPLTAPPLKPFTRKGSHAAAKPPAAPFRSDLPPRRAADIPGTARRPERPRTGNDSDGRRLTVGRDICLTGEISSCDKLVVEGRVDAKLHGARVIEVSSSGFFRGAAEVDEADISGLFEGDLVARSRLIIRSGGKIIGAVRYGKIVIEAGGQVVGNMEAMEQKALPEPPALEPPALPLGESSSE